MDRQSFFILSSQEHSKLGVMPHRRCFMEMELTFNIGRAEKLIGRAEKQIRYFAHPEKRKFPAPEVDGQYKFRTCQRTSSQTRPNLLPDATESAPRRDRICSQTRLRLLPRSLNGIGLELTPLLPFCQTILSSLNFKRVSQQRLTRKSCWRKDRKKPANIRPQVSILSLFALCVNN